MKRLLSGLAMTMWVAASLAQGPLTPPGAPAPTQKTLAQIEPRMEISSLPLGTGGRHISAPGSYYLTANLIGETIEVTASNVSIDLGGFALIGGPGIFTGIQVGGSNVKIHNGNITGCSQYAISAHDSSAIVIENVAIDNCGFGIGQIAGTGAFIASVNHVTISNCGSGVVLDQNGGNTGSGSTISNCRFYKITGQIAGASLVVDSTAEGCTLPPNVFGMSGAVVSRCSVTNSSGDYPFIVGGTVSECFVGECTGANGIAGSIISRCVVADMSSPVFSIIGIQSGIVESSLVSRCTSAANVYGIVASRVVDCRVDLSSANGGIIGITASGLIANGNPAVLRSSVQGPMSSSGSNIGILSYAGGAVDDCSVSTCSTYGISTTDADVRNSKVSSCNVGIICTNSGSGGRVEGNTLTSCFMGISISGSTLVVRNYFKGSVLAISGDMSTSQIGEMVTATGTIPATVGPWANFVQP